MFSRKFLLALVGVFMSILIIAKALLLNDLATAMDGLTALLAASGIFTAAEGAADVVERYQKTKGDTAIDLVRVDAKLNGTLSNEDHDEERTIVNGAIG